MNRISHSVLKEVGFTLLAEGKTLRVKAEGYSMYPAIKPGSVIYIEPFKPAAGPLPGEVIAWKKEAGFIVHRLLRISKEGEQIQYITRGDSCLSEDEPVTFDQLAGRVVRVEDRKGRALTGLININKTPSYRINRIKVWISVKLRRIWRIVR